MKKINIALVIFSITMSVLSLPSLPSQVPMHWNIAGDIDNWMPKESAIWFFPGIIAAMALLFHVVPHSDPKNAKYAQFKREWEVMQVGLLGFFVYIQMITFHIARTPGASIFPSFFVGLGALFILLGNYMSKIRQNYFIGVKTPWTLANEDSWNKTHRVASWCFVLSGLVIIIEGFVQRFAPVVMLGSIMAAAIIPIVYSYLLFKSGLIDKS